MLKLPNSIFSFTGIDYLYSLESKYTYHSLESIVNHQIFGFSIKQKSVVNRVLTWMKPHCYKNWWKIMSTISDGAGPNYQDDGKQFRNSRWTYSVFPSCFCLFEKLRRASLFQWWKFPTISKFSDEISFCHDAQLFRNFPPTRLNFLRMDIFDSLKVFRSDYLFQWCKFPTV